MQFTGKITEILPAKSGTSARSGNAWRSQEYVIRETTGEYPQSLLFRIFGAEKIEQCNLQLGEVYTISFDVKVHEFNGRFFNDVNCYKAVLANAQEEAQPQEAAPSPTPAAAPVPPPPVAAPPVTDMQSDLPF